MQSKADRQKRDLDNSEQQLKQDEKQETIAQIVQKLTPAQAKKEAKELANFLDDPESSTSYKDWIWLSLLEARASGETVTEEQA